MFTGAFLLLFFASIVKGDEPESKCYSRFDFEEKLLMKLTKVEHQSELLKSERFERTAEFEDVMEHIKKRSAAERKMQQNLTALMADYFESEKNEHSRISTEEIRKQENITLEMMDMKAKQINEFENELKNFKEKCDFELKKLQELNRVLEENIIEEKRGRLDKFELQMEEFKKNTAKEIENQKSTFESEIDVFRKEIERQKQFSSALQGNDTLHKTPLVVFTVTSPTEGPGLDTLSFRKEIINEGGGFDIKTGKFTCPVAGVYFFSIHLVKMARNVHNTYGIDIYIKVNGFVEVEINLVERGISDVKDGEVSRSFYLTLAVEDVVTISNDHFFGRRRTLAYILKDSSLFSGHMIRPYYVIP